MSWKYIWHVYITGIYITIHIIVVKFYCFTSSKCKCFQDFQALTPNLIATTIETVQGGGFIILLIRSLSSLTSLYTMVMVR